MDTNPNDFNPEVLDLSRLSSDMQRAICTLARGRRLDGVFHYLECSKVAPVGPVEEVLLWDAFSALCDECMHLIETGTMTLQGELVKIYKFHQGIQPRSTLMLYREGVHLTQLLTMFPDLEPIREQIEAIITNALERNALWVTRHGLEALKLILVLERRGESFSSQGDLPTRLGAIKEQELLEMSSLSSERRTLLWSSAAVGTMLRTFSHHPLLWEALEGWVTGEHSLLVPSWVLELRDSLSDMLPLDPMINYATLSDGDDARVLETLVALAEDGLDATRALGAARALCA